VPNCHPQHELKLAFYGDDFTGSTDALECLATAGLKTVLFVAPPSAEQLAKHAPLDAIGVAGHSRSLPTDQLEAEVRPTLSALRKLGARHVHYKVCSTFDSSPSVGSIGRVVDIATEIFDSSVVPLLVGAPALGRWCVFGNLFARVGIGSDGDICRLDRHPAMQNHPTTPASESDLRLHLGAQTDMPIGLVDVLSLEANSEHPISLLQMHEREEPSVVLFDAITEQHLSTIGAALDSYAREHQPLFSVGSSGVEMALLSQWSPPKTSRPCPPVSKASNGGPVLVVSGSCSPVTAGQIAHAQQDGFVTVAMNVEKLFDSPKSKESIQEATADTISLLEAGTNVIVHTAPTDGASTNVTSKTNTAPVIGNALGQVLHEAVAQSSICRVCIAGGDTSSFAAKAMHIESLEMVAPLTRGAPICRISSLHPRFDGLEVVFKGGQVGKSDFFISLAGIS